MYVLPKAERAALRVLNAVMRGCKCCIACELRLDDQMMHSLHTFQVQPGRKPSAGRDPARHRPAGFAIVRVAIWAEEERAKKSAC